MRAVRVYSHGLVRVGCGSVGCGGMPVHWYKQLKQHECWVHTRVYIYSKSQPFCSTKYVRRAQRGCCDCPNISSPKKETKFRHLVSAIFWVVGLVSFLFTRNLNRIQIFSRIPHRTKQWSLSFNKDWYVWIFNKQLKSWIVPVLTVSSLYRNRILRFIAAFTTAWRRLLCSALWSSPRRPTLYI
jgi:hypothetical protein